MKDRWWGDKDFCKNGRRYENNKIYTQECCHDYDELTLKLECHDSYGDGWHGGYIEIDGKKYCQNFNSGKQKDETVKMSKS